MSEGLFPPALSRAARGLNGVSLEDLAASTSLAIDVLAAFEAGQAELPKSALRRCQSAFLEAGVAVVDEGGAPVGVRRFTGPAVGGGRHPWRPCETFWTGQSRAARGLLGWSARELAARSGLAIADLAEFEAGRIELAPEAHSAICSTFASAAVRAIGNTPNCAGVRFDHAPDLWAARAQASFDLFGAANGG